MPSKVSFSLTFNALFGSRRLFGSCYSSCLCICSIHVYMTICLPPMPSGPPLSFTCRVDDPLPTPQKSFPVGWTGLCLLPFKREQSILQLFLGKDYSSVPMLVYKNFSIHQLCDAPQSVLQARGVQQSVSCLFQAFQQPLPPFTFLPLLPVLSHLQSLWGANERTQSAHGTTQWLHIWRKGSCTISTAVTVILEFFYF